MMRMRTRRRWLTAWLLLVLPIVADCSATSGSEAQDGKPVAPVAAATSSAKPKPKAQAPRVVLAPPGHDAVSVRVELARNEAERERGLMFRKQLEPDAGMLFLFEESRQLTFWMHNTYLPLDMIFIREDLTILGVVENATPLTDAPRRVEGVSRYVLEVNAGFARRHGLQPGTSVRFVGVPGMTEAKTP